MRKAPRKHSLLVLLPGLINVAIPLVISRHGGWFLGAAFGSAFPGMALIFLYCGVRDGAFYARDEQWITSSESPLTYGAICTLLSVVYLVFTGLNLQLALQLIHASNEVP